MCFIRAERRSAPLRVRRTGPSGLPECRFVKSCPGIALYPEGWYLFRQGRSSDSFRFRRLPGYPPVAEIVDSSCARFRTGTYSSGNCCRFTRHSLLIPLHGETIARQRYAFIGRKQAIRRNISAKRAPPLCAADRSDHDASLFRQTAARLWHALCTYFSQLRHSNRSEVSSFI